MNWLVEKFCGVDVLCGVDCGVKCGKYNHVANKTWQEVCMDFCDCRQHTYTFNYINIPVSSKIMGVS